MRMRRIILSSVACPDVLFFSIVSQTVGFAKKNHATCVFTFSTILSEAFLILKKVSEI